MRVRYLAFVLLIAVALLICIGLVVLFVLEIFVHGPSEGLIHLKKLWNQLVSWAKEPLHPASLLSTPGIR